MEGEMEFSDSHYVPCLRWKRGEYQAILKLPNSIKQVMTPLIEVPEMGWDFEKNEVLKTIDELLKPFAKRVNDKWGKLPCFIDLGLLDSIEKMATGIHPLSFIFEELQKMGCSSIPVTGINKDDVYQNEIKNIIKKNTLDICLRVKIEQVETPSFKSDLDKLLKVFGVTINHIHFILDLGAPNFLPIEGFARLLKKIISNLPYLNEWKTFVILSTSFPESMAIVKKGNNTLPRYEWLLYKNIISKFLDEETRLPTFGDYTISHPKVLEIDMRIVKPAATIRYTIEDEWLIIKGENVREYGFKQYHDLSRNLSTSKYYSGSTFSFGDEYIQLCADKKVKTGSLTTWREIGTNHHITMLTKDIASFYVA
jgi:hypothetical protein